MLPRHVNIVDTDARRDFIRISPLQPWHRRKINTFGQPNILSAVLDEFSISIPSTRLISFSPFFQKRRKGRKKIENIQSLSAHKLITFYFGNIFTNLLDERDVKVKRTVDCSPEVVKFWNILGPIFLVWISLAWTTCYAATWLQFLGDWFPVFHWIIG